MLFWAIRLFSHIRVYIVQQCIEVRLKGETLAQRGVVLFVEAIRVGVFEELQPFVVEREHRSHLCHVRRAEIADGDA